MKKNNRSQEFNALRRKYPFFIYEDFKVDYEEQALKITFTFNLSDEYIFQPHLIVPLPATRSRAISQDAVAHLAFNIGMVELISYWKAACPRQVIIKPATITARAIEWWKKLWFRGLGEFFYLNGIETNEDDFLEVKCQSNHSFTAFNFVGEESVMVPVGGGKDSAVTLEVLKNGGKQVVPFIMNPRAANWDTLTSAALTKEKALVATRSIDPLLIELNTKGFLNGHTPFSALLAFVTLLAGSLNGLKHIALSNESSANEATIPGTLINHQYSKSWQFEHDFREYVRAFISPDFNYFSFLRPLNELQIASLFSRFPRHFSTFRSCNAGSKTNVWCGKCPKCLFTAIILSPFVNQQMLKTIFAGNILDDKSLMPVFDELTGVAEAKPFECVGTTGEVNAAVQAAISVIGENPLPALFSHYQNKNTKGKELAFFMADFNKEHFLNKEFLNILQKALHV